MFSIRESGTRLWVAPILLLAVGACGGADGEPGAGGATASRVQLSEPDATFPEALSSIVGIRELADGRLFVADRLGQALMLVDLTAGTADTIGRTGGGPGEYNVPGALFPWRGDSTLMIDMGNTRFTPIGPDGGFGISLPLMSQDGEAMRLVIPEGTDRNGCVYFRARNISIGAGGLRASNDSVFIVRWNPETDLTDTVAALGQPERNIQRTGGSTLVTPVPFSPSDAWSVAWDGSVGVARGTGFRIEWTNPDGSRVIGGSIAYTPVEITQADKDAWLAARDNPVGGMFIAVQGGGGGGGGASVRTAPTPRGAGAVAITPEIADEDWPEVKPPFPPQAVSATPEGELWVQRHVSHGALPEYDVYDGNGDRIRTVVLADNSRVVGFGNGVVYVARTDEDDLQWLERYRR